MNNIYVDFSKTNGKIKKLNGVNNGPFERCFTYNMVKWFRDANIPLCRLHNIEGHGGAGHFVDIHAVFKDFSKDPTDPKNYSFDDTDAYLKAIKQAHADIIYRLGTSNEYMANTNVKSGGVPPININPPSDYKKWAQICERIIMHYNEGWADGFHMDISYWEIWNEPESKASWTGTTEEFNEFYVTTSKYLKEKFPNLKIGGYGSMGFYPETRQNQEGFCDEPYINLIDKTKAFLKKVKEENAPLDFFSWHLYSDDPKEYGIHARAARRILDEAGFMNTQSILDEWNGEDVKKIKTPTNASLAAGVFCELQNSPVDIAAYSNARVPSAYNGLFYARGSEKKVRRKTYFVFKAFSHLYSLENSVETTTQGNIYSMAAKNDFETAILISNHEQEEKIVKTDIKGLTGDKFEVLTYAINDEMNLELIKKEKVNKKDFVLYNNMKENNVLMIRIKKRA